MNGLVNGINIEIERSWTWVYGNTYPVKEELKAQGFLWSGKRRAWYNRSIVEVNLNNGNGHKEVKESQHTKEDVIGEVLNETRIKKIAEADKAIRVIWDNIDKVEDIRGLINAGDKRWNTDTSKYVKANYEKVVELTKEAIRRFEKKEPQQPKEDTQQKEKAQDRVKVRILEKLPTFMGADLKIYKLNPNGGEYMERAGDDPHKFKGCVELPKENATILIKRGVAEQVTEEYANEIEGLKEKFGELRLI